MRPFYQAPSYSIPAPIRPVNPSFFQANPFARIPPNIPTPQRGIPGFQGFQGSRGFQGFQGFQGMPGMQEIPGIQGAQGIPAAAATATAAAATPFRLDQFMNQAGQFMQSAQKYAPLFQQARPMLNNLPVLWKLYKGFKSTTPSQEEEQVIRSPRAQQRFEESRSSTRSSLNNETRPSIPKIYQPNFENFQ